jgi:hypothetical protein
MIIMKRMDFTDQVDIENYVLSHLSQVTPASHKLIYYGLIRISKAKLAEFCEKLEL